MNGKLLAIGVGMTSIFGTLAIVGLTIVVKAVTK